MHLFLKEAVKEIHEATHGYPRRIIMLCHKALKELILKNQSVVDANLIGEIVKAEIQAGWHTNEKNPLLLKNSY